MYLNDRYVTTTLVVLVVYALTAKASFIGKVGTILL
jgi:hypothetical protein